MIEPPSADLQRILRELRLCRPHDLRACRPFVRRLTHDLPAFDSVWIDALVQIGRLTPFQARVLQSRSPESLQVGPCVLVDELGAAERSSHTYLAVHRESAGRRVLKVLDVPLDEQAARQTAVQEAIEQTRGMKSPDLVTPQACLSHQSRLFVVSPFFPGRDLREIVVRRGRLPVDVVSAIAAQLCKSLSQLESQGLAHGDLRISKVRLTSQGRIGLVDCGASSFVNRWTQIHRLQRPEQCETTPPELIGTDRRPDAKSDMYALGCLLWQLLAGRAVFPYGDALSRLAAHQTQSVPPIEEINPSTPAGLARLIAQLTAADPAERPASFNALLDHSAVAGRLRPTRVRRYLQQHRLKGRSEPSRRRIRRTVALVFAATLLLSAGLIFSLTHAGARTQLLTIANQVSNRLWSAETSPANTATSDVSTSSGHGSQTDATVTLEPDFPLPDRRGVVRLIDGKSYGVAQLNHGDQIVLRGTGSRPARIVIDQEPLRLAAPVVELENIEIVLKEGSEGPIAGSLVLVQANQLTVKRSVFVGRSDTGMMPGTRTIARPLGLAWKPIQPRTPTSIEMDDCLFLGQSSVLYCAQKIDRLSFVNCLKAGGGAMANLPAPRATEVTESRLEHLTVRGADALLRIRLSADQAAGEIAVVSNHSVFELHSRGALFQFLGATGERPQRQLVNVAGEGSLSRPDTQIVGVLLKSQSDPGAEFEPDEQWDRLVRIEGIAASPFRFVGRISGRAQDSVVGDFQTQPRLASDEPQATVVSPGINPSSLPTSSTTGQTRVGIRELPNSIR